MIAEKLTFEDFEPHLDSVFTIIDEDVPATALVLTEAKLLKTHQLAEGFRVPFSLLFEGPAPVLPQRLYHFQHDAMGQQVIFIVPIAKTGDGFQYEAVFN